MLGTCGWWCCYLPRCLKWWLRCHDIQPALHPAENNGSSLLACCIYAVTGLWLGWSIWATYGWQRSVIGSDYPRTGERRDTCVAEQGWNREEGRLTNCVKRKHKHFQSYCSVEFLYCLCGWTLLNSSDFSVCFSTTLSTSLNSEWFCVDFAEWILAFYQTQK